MGTLHCATDDGLNRVYVYRRDFSDTPDPLEEPLTLQTLTRLVAGRHHLLKSVLVGKEAALVGIFNGGFQDIIYRAGLHPRRKASELTSAELQHLRRALQTVIDERLRLGGQTDFVDLYGRPGGYEPAMGPAHKGIACRVCGSLPDELSLGGGRIFYCSPCQR
jgi:formamidopyrimidine-DNA glycosylase